MRLLLSYVLLVVAANRLRRRTMTGIASTRKAISEFSAEGLVQERLLQRLQRGVLPLVEAGEALGFFRQFVEFTDRNLLSERYAV